MSETTIDLPVLGMTCAACVRRVERAVSSVPGIASAEVNLPLSRARIVFDPAVANPRGAAAAIREAGYEVPEDVIDALARGRTAGAGQSRLDAIARAERDELRTLKRDATLAIGLTAPLLALAMAHGVFEGTATVIVQLVLGSFVVLVPGRHYFRRGWIAVRHRSPDMNTLIALGAGVAWLSSTIVAARWLAGPRHHMPAIYFEAGAAIVAFVMIGKLLESRARARVTQSVRGLVSLSPAIAHELTEGQAPQLALGPAADDSGLDDDGTVWSGRMGDGAEPSEGAEHGRTGAGTASITSSEGAELGRTRIEHDVDAASLVAGAVVRVRPGERVPADGTIIEGRSALDESLLTGESLPVDKAEGSPVYAGTLNHHGALSVRVARAGADTALARIARAVEDAQGSKAPIARLADRVSAWFVPVVLAIAVVTMIAWLVAGAGSSVAIERMVAVLVIACPCALGLATPAAVAVGTARGAELGILFRGGDALEVASQIDVVCLDKTGTLTAGHPALIVVTNDEVLRVAASAEQGSEHPIGRAIVDEAKRRGVPLERAIDVTMAPGGGLTARVAGKTVKVGTREFVGASVAEDHANGTLSYVTVDGAVIGTIVVADPPSPEAKTAVSALRGMGIEPVMITGDREGAARWIAGEVGITRVHAEVKPTGKAALVAAQRVNGKRVAMVGDGINDAPALAEADLGVALGSGTELAAATADVTLLRGGIGSLPRAFTLARATLHTIRRNLVAAFAYNIICIPIAAGALYPLTGWLLSPVLASAAMSLSSVTVLASSLRLRRA